MERTVFTNGCFDLIHPGHVDLLARARALGSRLVVGINSDRSVRSIKGPGRPLMNEAERRAVLLGLRSVDEVVIFDDATPERVIRELRPAVLVKGGDWAADEIVGADFVRSIGGEVRSLPLLEGYSTTSIVERMTTAEAGRAPALAGTTAEPSVDEHADVIRDYSVSALSAVRSAAVSIAETFRRGGKVLVCGNGGSAADAQHLAAELVGRFEAERRALPVIALTTDTSALTAITNDFDFKRVFARQVEALGQAGDLLVAISTSGNSPNVIAAAMAARERGLVTVALTGQGGRKLAGLCDHAVLVPSGRTARIQEAHILTIHLWCESIERAFREK
jgi:D-sedoheptulose 7-phosphate isomerase